MAKGFICGGFLTLLEDKLQHGRPWPDLEKAGRPEGSERVRKGLGRRARNFEPLPPSPKMRSQREGLDPPKPPGGTLEKPGKVLGV